MTPKPGMTGFDAVPLCIWVSQQLKGVFLWVFYTTCSWRVISRFIFAFASMRCSVVGLRNGLLLCLTLLFLRLAVFVYLPDFR